MLYFNNLNSFNHWVDMLDETKEANQNEQNIETGNKTQEKTSTTRYALHTTMHKHTKTQYDMCCTPLCTNTHKNTMRHDPSYKQLVVKTNRTSFTCENRN